MVYYNKIPLLIISMFRVSVSVVKWINQRISKRNFKKYKVIKREKGFVALICTC